MVSQQLHRGDASSRRMTHAPPQAPSLLFPPPTLTHLPWAVATGHAEQQHLARQTWSVTARLAGCL